MFYSRINIIKSNIINLKNIYLLMETLLLSRLPEAYVIFSYRRHITNYSCFLLIISICVASGNRV
jgi:hypothetical protein